MVTEPGDPVIVQGEYTVSVGGGQPHTGAAVATQAFRVDGQLKLPE
jgi:beta-glucosidase